MNDFSNVKLVQSPSKHLHVPQEEVLLENILSHDLWCRLLAEDVWCFLVRSVYEDFIYRKWCSS